MSILTKMGNYLTDKIRGPFYGIGSVQAMIGMFGDPGEYQRLMHFQRLYDYYVNDERRIKNYTVRAMSGGATSLIGTAVGAGYGNGEAPAGTFKPETIAQMQLPYFNIVRRIIQRLALAYKIPAERYIHINQTKQQGSDGKIAVKEDPKQVKANENYQECLEGSNINSQAKLWHRFAKLLDTVYIEPVWRDDHIEYDIYPPHVLSVRESPSSYLQAEAIMYQSSIDNEAAYTFWSADEHAVVDDKGNKIEGRNPTGGVNPYGVLPFVPLRLRETENHWGEGDTQLVDINEKINILLASTYYNAIMQSHGQLVAVNMGLKGRVATGPDKIIEVDSVDSSMVAPHMDYIHPNPATKECWAMIESMTKTAAMMRGLSASAVSIEPQAHSGAAKAIDNWELLESREDDLEFLRPFEKQLFDVTRAIWNFHNSDKQIPDDVKFGIDFAPIRNPVSELDELKGKSLKLALGLWTPVDDMVNEDEGVDRDMAMLMVKKNLEVRNELNDEYGLTAALTSSANLDNGDPSGDATQGEGVKDILNVKA